MSKKPPLRYSTNEVCEYLCCWLHGWLDANTSWHDIEDVESAFGNAREMLRAEGDGIEALVRSRARTVMAAEEGAAETIC